MSPMRTDAGFGILLVVCLPVASVKMAAKTRPVGGDTADDAVGCFWTGGVAVEMEGLGPGYVDHEPPNKDDTGDVADETEVGESLLPCSEPNPHVGVALAVGAMPKPKRGGVLKEDILLFTKG